MKQVTFLLIAVFGVALLSSCGHQMATIGLGTGWTAGSPEYGVKYGEGLFGMFVTKDGVRFKAELDSTEGFTYDAKSNTYRGIRSIEYEIAPQITGYAVEMSANSPEAMKAYYDALAAYYGAKETKTEIKVETAAEEPEEETASSEETPAEEKKDVAEIIAKAISQARVIVNAINKKEKFECNGNCEYTNLGKNRKIDYQLSIAMKLLAYDGYTNKMEDTGECYTTTLEHFVTQNITSKSKGNKETPLRVKYVTVKDGVITKLMYVYDDDGNDTEITCPSCVLVP